MVVATTMVIVVQFMFNTHTPFNEHHCFRFMGSTII